MDQILKIDSRFDYDKNSDKSINCDGEKARWQQHQKKYFLVSLNSLKII